MRNYYETARIYRGRNCHIIDAIFAACMLALVIALAIWGMCEPTAATAGLAACAGCGL